MGRGTVKTESGFSRGEEKKTANPLNRFLSVLCFFLGTALAVPAFWLCIRGSLPPIPIDDTAFIPIDGISINGVPVGKWAFGSTVTGLFVTALALFFAGWQATRARGTSKTS
jgi:hypothetical protein